MWSQDTLIISTTGRGLMDITSKIDSVLSQHGLSIGLCHVFCQHTSASLTINENWDPDVRTDLETIFSRLAPDGDRAYIHTLEGPDDMAAHARTSLSQTELTLPVQDGKLQLGQWQGIYLWEHRYAGHERRLIITLQGEMS